jgi:hypothetical protein
VMKREGSRYPAHDQLIFVIAVEARLEMRCMTYCRRLGRERILPNGHPL